MQMNWRMKSLDFLGWKVGLEITESAIGIFENLKGKVDDMPGDKLLRKAALTLRFPFVGPPKKICSSSSTRDSSGSRAKGKISMMNVVR